MTGNDSTLFVDQDRRSESPLLDACRQLSDLLVAVRAAVFCVRHQLINGPLFDFVGRVCFLFAHDAIHFKNASAAKSTSNIQFPVVQPNTKPMIIKSSMVLLSLFFVVIRVIPLQVG
jgi:hypothetical protein